MVEAMRVKSPFSHSALFGFIFILSLRLLQRNHAQYQSKHSPPQAKQPAPKQEKQKSVLHETAVVRVPGGGTGCAHKNDWAGGLKVTAWALDPPVGLHYTFP